MTREEFIDLIEKRNYPYSIEGDTIVFSSRINNIRFDITSIPSNVEFKNAGDVFMLNLISVPSNVKFNNGGSVFLTRVISIDSSSVFLNEGGLFLNRSMIPRNIEGIDNKRLINLMISKGLFER